MTRIGYCLMVHKNPRQVGRLIKNIFSPKDLFYVNVFGKHFTQDWTKEFKAFESDTFFLVHKYATAWGTFQLVDAMK